MPCQVYCRNLSFEDVTRKGLSSLHPGYSSRAQFCHHLHLTTLCRRRKFWACWSALRVWYRQSRRQGHWHHCWRPICRDKDNWSWGWFLSIHFLKHLPVPVPKHFHGIHGRRRCLGSSVLALQASVTFDFPSVGIDVEPACQIEMHSLTAD